MSLATIKMLIELFSRIGVPHTVVSYNGSHQVSVAMVKFRLLRLLYKHWSRINNYRKSIGRKMRGLKTQKPDDPMAIDSKVLDVAFVICIVMSVD